MGINSILGGPAWLGWVEAKLKQAEEAAKKEGTKVEVLYPACKPFTASKDLCGDTYVTVTVVKAKEPPTRFNGRF